MQTDLDQITEVLRLYFQIFNKLNSEEEMPSKTMGLILKGISSAVETLDKTALESVVKAVANDIDTLFQMTHKPNFKLRVQSLTLIFSLVKVEEELKDRFY